MSPKSRIDKEKRIVELMIRIYCRKKEGNSSLCIECKEILNYALARLDCCPFGEDKTACKDCSIHCYKPEMRNKIKKIMRYSGPRMIIYNPIEFIKHYL